MQKNREKFITMFGGASDNVSDEYKNVVYELFGKIADTGLSLCFGGGSTGIMGAAARGYKDSSNNSFLLGVAPTWMSEFEPIFDKCDELKLTKDMEDRKRILCQTSKAYILCPGGQGTIEEWALCSVSRQLQRIPEDSRIILFNYNGFYNDFISFLKRAVDEGFLSADAFSATIVCADADSIIETIQKIYVL